MTSLGVMLTSKWSTGPIGWPGAMYRVACRCGDPDCGLTMDFHFDDGIFQIHFYQKTKWPYWKADSKKELIWMKIKACFSIWFKSDLEMESDMTIIEEEHFQGIIDALEEAKIKMREHETYLMKNWINILADKTIKNEDDKSKQ